MMPQQLRGRSLSYFGAPGNHWRYALAEPFGCHSHHLTGVHFENAWLTIRNGDIVIRAGYAWNGCSPCVSAFGLFYFGTPDGAAHLGKPATYHASLVHDALCQWRRELPISKPASVAVFRQLLDDVKFPLAGLYTWAVRHFGPQDFGGGRGRRSTER